MGHGSGPPSLGAADVLAALAVKACPSWSAGTVKTDQASHHVPMAKPFGSAVLGPVLPAKHQLAVLGRVQYSVLFSA